MEHITPLFFCFQDFLQLLSALDVSQFDHPKEIKIHDILGGLYEKQYYRRVIVNIRSTQSMAYKHYI